MKLLKAIPSVLAIVPFLLLILAFADNKPSAPAPIVVGPATAEKLRTDQQAALQFAGETQALGNLLTPYADCACVKAFLDARQKETQLKISEYNREVLELRVDLHVAKDWGYDVKAGQFTPPAVAPLSTETNGKTK